MWFGCGLEGGIMICSCIRVVEICGNGGRIGVRVNRVFCKGIKVCENCKGVSRMYDIDRRCVGGN